MDDVPTYETGYVSCPLINEKKEFEEGAIDLAVFTSASTVKGFVESTKGLDYSRVRAACIGKTDSCSGGFLWNADIYVRKSNHRQSDRTGLRH